MGGYKTVINNWHLLYADLTSKTCISSDAVICGDHLIDVGHYIHLAVIRQLRTGGGYDTGFHD